MTITEAFDVIKEAMQDDPEYAWSWHCNIAMAAYDEGVPHDVANKAATRFMQMCFKVKTGFEEMNNDDSKNQSR